MTAQSTAQLRDASAGAEARHPGDPGPARAPKARTPRTTARWRPAPCARSPVRWDAWARRTAQAGHLSLGKLKVMSAIEHCRTPLLGGHVEQCDACGHIQIAYNSCHNRHPEVSGRGVAAVAGAIRTGSGRTDFNSWIHLITKKSQPIHDALKHAFLRPLALHTWWGQTRSKPPGGRRTLRSRSGSGAGAGAS